MFIRRYERSTSTMAQSKITLTIQGELTALNKYIGALNRNRFMGAKLKRDETERVATECMVAGLEACLEPVTLHFHWYMKNDRKDLDNIAFAKKFILDGMVQAGLLYDDSHKWVRGFTDSFEIDKSNPRVEIEIKEVNL